jgi:hypothetical protein
MNADEDKTIRKAGTQEQKAAEWLTSSSVLFS